MVPVWSFHNHIKSGKLGVKPVTVVHTALEDSIAKSISPLLHVLPLFHLSLTHKDLRYMKAGQAELIEKKQKSNHWEHPLLLLWMPGKL